MSFIETTAVEDAEGAVREMYERQQAAWGYVPNYAKSFSPPPWRACSGESRACSSEKAPEKKIRKSPRPKPRK